MMLADRHFDTIIVGARCAGSATALLLARAGQRVLVVDRAPRASDTLSTHALMRGAMLQLRRWGVLEACTADTPPIRSTSFHYGEARIDIPIKPRHGVDAFAAPRRFLLDAALADAAAAAGATFAFDTRVVDVLRRRDGRVTGVIVADGHDRHVDVRGDLVIGADGLHSSIAKLVSASVYSQGSHAAGVVYGYWRGLGLDASHWCFIEGATAGAIPTTGGLTCVFASVPAARFRDVFQPVHDGYMRTLGEVSPWLAEHLAHGHLEGSLKGFGGVRGLFRRSHGRGWALVGDAGCFKDPATAHGITDALRDAEVLARTVLRGTDDALGDYEQERDALARPIFDITDAIASCRWTLDTLPGLHKRLSDAMNDEADAIAGWTLPYDAETSASPRTATASA